MSAARRVADATRPRSRRRPGNSASPGAISHRSAWATGAMVLLVRGVKLLFLNWRVTLIDLVPAVWVWLVMWDLKQHALRNDAFPGDHGRRDGRPRRGRPRPGKPAATWDESSSPVSSWASSSRSAPLGSPVDPSEFGGETSPPQPKPGQVFGPDGTPVDPSELEDETPDSWAARPSLSSGLPNQLFNLAATPVLAWDATCVASQRTIWGRQVRRRCIGVRRRR